MKGTIVIHGGFDSFIEEFCSCATHFAAQGYDIILFEGPLQGAALKTYDLPLTREWEKPVGARPRPFRVGRRDAARVLDGRVVVLQGRCL